MIRVDLMTSTSVMHAASKKKKPTSVMRIVTSCFWLVILGAVVLFSIAVQLEDSIRIGSPYNDDILVNGIYCSQKNASVQMHGSVCAYRGGRWVWVR